MTGERRVEIGLPCPSVNQLRMVTVICLDRTDNGAKLTLFSDGDIVISGLDGERAVLVDRDDLARILESYRDLLDV